MQVEADAIDFNSGQIVITGVVQILHHSRGKAVNASILEFDYDAASRAIVLRRCGSGFRLQHCAPPGFGDLYLRLSRVDHGSAPTPATTCLGNRDLGDQTTHVGSLDAYAEYNLRPAIRPKQIDFCLPLSRQVNMRWFVIRRVDDEPEAASTVYQDH